MNKVFCSALLIAMMYFAGSYYFDRPDAVEEPVQQVHDVERQALLGKRSELPQVGEQHGHVLFDGVGCAALGRPVLGREDAHGHVARRPQAAGQADRRLQPVRALYEGLVLGLGLALPLSLFSAIGILCTLLLRQAADGEAVSDPKD